MRFDFPKGFGCWGRRVGQLWKDKHNSCEFLHHRDVYYTSSRGRSFYITTYLLIAALSKVQAWYRRIHLRQASLSKQLGNKRNNAAIDAIRNQTPYHRFWSSRVKYDNTHRHTCIFFLEFNPTLFWYLHIWSEGPPTRRRYQVNIAHIHYYGDYPFKESCTHAYVACVLLKACPPEVSFLKGKWLTEDGKPRFASSHVGYTLLEPPAIQMVRSK